MKPIVIIITAFILVSPLILRAEEISLTLDEAIAIALRDNRDVLLKTEDVKKAKEKISEANASLFPTLNITGGWTDTRGYYTKDLGQTTTQTTLKQYLYKGGKTVNTIKQNKYKFEVSQALLDKTKLETVLNVKKTFYTLLLAREFTRINKSIVENTVEHFSSLKERYKTGQASESDILTIEASLYSVQEAYEASLNRVQASATLLKNLLYLDDRVSIIPAAQFIYEPKVVAYTEGFLEALKDRPEIRQYAAQQNADKKAIEIAKADNRPNIYASWDYYSRSHISATTSRNWNDYNIIGITFTWPVFDGWATNAKVEQAIIDLKETQLNKEKTIKDIALELGGAYLDLKNAVAKIRAAESEAKVYRDNLASTRQKYQQGIVSFLDMQDANLKYDVSIFNKKQAVYDYIIAKSSFDKATGGI